MESYNTFSDQQLLALLRQDDSEAFSEIYNRYWSPLFSTAYKRLRDKEQCRDVLQNLFTDIWNRKNSFQVENLAAYLHSSVRFLLYKQLAKSPLRAVYYQEFEETIASPFLADDLVNDKELMKLLESWIEALPEKRRKIFLLYYSEDLSTSEIAERLGVSRKTVQNQIVNANVYLRTRFAQFLCLSFVLPYIFRK